MHTNLPFNNVVIIIVVDNISIVSLLVVEKTLVTVEVLLLALMVISDGITKAVLLKLPSS